MHIVCVIVSLFAVLVGDVALGTHQAGDDVSAHGTCAEVEGSLPALLSALEQLPVYHESVGALSAGSSRTAAPGSDTPHQTGPLQHQQSMVVLGQLLPNSALLSEHPSVGSRTTQTLDAWPIPSSQSMLQLLAFQQLLNLQQIALLQRPHQAMVAPVRGKVFRRM